MNKVEILDCSLRDGGYRTNWHFSRVRVKSLIENLERLGIPRVELGFKFPNRESSMGPFSNVTDHLAEELHGSKIALGFMLESKGFAAFPDHRRFIEWTLRDSSLFKFVRIATTMDDLADTLKIASAITDAGKEVFVNIMRASELSLDDLRKVPSPGWGGIGGYYLADSFGSMNGNNTSQLVSWLVSEGHRVGFHGHNNRGMAFANSLAAIEAGATLIDGTFAGHGRGSGNTKTEELAAEIPEYSAALMETLFELGEHLETHEYAPGDASGENSFAFHLGAKLGLHPNLVMNIFRSNPKLGLGEVLTILGRSLSATPQDSDPVSLVRETPDVARTIPAQSVKFPLRGKKFFLFTRGLSLDSAYSDFEHFKNVKGIASGFLNGVPDGMSADLVFALHPFRRGVVAKSIGQAPSLERVCGFSDGLASDSEGSWTYVPAQFGENGFKPSSPKNPLGIPANTVLAFALGVLGSAEVEEVCLGGFDISIDPAEEKENRYVIAEFQKVFPQVRLSTVGESQYGLEQVSLW